MRIMKVVPLIVVCLWAYLPCTNQQFPTNAEELTMTAVEGLSQNIEVTCGFNENLGTVFWVINDIISDLNRNIFSCFERDGLYTLRIPIIQLCLNDTSFQCLSSVIHPPGRVTRIYVLKNPFTQTSNRCDCIELESSELLDSGECVEPEYNELDINSQTLIIHKENVTTFEFFTPFPCNESNIYLEIYNIIDPNILTEILLLCCDANISSSKILSDENTTLILRLISSMDCQNKTRNYTINGIASICEDISTTQTIRNGTDTVCIPFPVSTTICDMITTMQLVLSSKCSIVLDYFDGNFNSYRNCKDWDKCNYNLTISTSEVCFYGWNTEFTNTVVHFQCTTTDPNGLAFYHLLSSHEIITDTSMYPTSPVQTMTTSSNTAYRTPSTPFTSTTKHNAFSTSSSNSTNMPTSATNVPLIVIPVLALFILIVVSVIAIVVIVWIKKNLWSPIFI